MKIEHRVIADSPSIFIRDGEAGFMTYCVKSQEILPTEVGK